MASPALNLPHDFVRDRGPLAVAQAAIARAEQAEGGFWIHVDADVLDPAIMPAVDTPLPDGLTLDALAELLTPLVRHPKALGLQLTIYDPIAIPMAAAPSVSPRSWNASSLRAGENHE
jgi:arginase